MGKREFNPYANGIPEKKEQPSRYEAVRDTKPGSKGASAKKATADKNPSAKAEAVSAHIQQAGNAPAGHASTRVAGASGDRPIVPKVDRDLLDGLEGNHRRQRGWEEMSKPNEVVDGISITPITRKELQEKLAKQSSGGFLGGKNL